MVVCGVYQPDSLSCFALKVDDFSAIIYECIERRSIRSAWSKAFSTDFGEISDLGKGLYRTACTFFRIGSHKPQLSIDFLGVRFQTAEYFPVRPWKKPINIAQWLNPA